MRVLGLASLGWGEIMDSVGLVDRAELLLGLRVLILDRKIGLALTLVPIMHRLA